MNRTNNKPRARRHVTNNTLRHAQARPARPFNRQPRRQPSMTRFSFSVVAAFAGALSLLVWALMFGRLDSQVDYHGDSQERIQRLADTYFSETSHLRFSFDERSFQRYLERNAPFYSNISVSLPLFSNQVAVEAEEPVAALRWQSGGVQYALSRSGYVIDKAGDVHQDLVVVFDGADLQYEVGQKLAPEQFVLFVTEVDKITKTEDQRFTVESYAITESSHSLTLRTSEYDIKLSTSIDPAAQLMTVNDLLIQLEEQGRPLPQEYIDTRVPGRVFWQ